MLARVVLAPYPMGDRTTDATLRASHLFSGVEDATVASLGAHTTRRRFARGEPIWRAREPASHISVIRSGLVKIVRLGDDGSSSIVSIFGPHETIGCLGALTGGAYLADAIAASASVEIASIDAHVLRAAVESCAPLARALADDLASLGRALDEKIQIMSAGTVERRLATLLLYLLERFGDELDGGPHFVPVSLTRIELASLVGATVETTSRTMSRWQRDGSVLTTHEGFAIADPHALRGVPEQAHAVARPGARRRSTDRSA